VKARFGPDARGENGRLLGPGVASVGGGTDGPIVSHAKHLRIYLNDHQAGSVGGCELARRALSQNQGNDYGRFLSRLLADIEQDQEVLRDLMARLGVPRARPKEAAAWAAEKIGRLKLNGRLVGYSPLSRLWELEALALGVEGKLALWKSLKQISGNQPALGSFDFDALAERARHQLDELEAFRLRAATEALEAPR
jgi:hypothetical protein